MKLLKLGNSITARDIRGYNIYEEQYRSSQYMNIYMNSQSFFLMYNRISILYDIIVFIFGNVVFYEEYNILCN